MSASPTVALTLDDDTLRRLARAVAAELRSTTPSNPQADGWLDAKGAAEYLGFRSTGPLHKLTASREIVFSQDTAGGKVWFRRSDLDDYRLASRVEPRA